MSSLAIVPVNREIVPAETRIIPANTNIATTRDNRPDKSLALPMGDTQAGSTRLRGLAEKLERESAESITHTTNTNVAPDSSPTSPRGLYVRHQGGFMEDLRRALRILSAQNPGPQSDNQPFLGGKISAKQASIIATKKPKENCIELSFPSPKKADKIVALHLLDPSGTKVLISGQRNGPTTFLFSNIDTIAKTFNLEECKVLVENRTLSGEARNMLRPLGFGILNTPDVFNGLLADNYHFKLGEALRQ
jgi:hypothetical protein